jgi:hypothetical protein
VGKKGVWAYGIEKREWLRFTVMKTWFSVVLEEAFVDVQSLRDGYIRAL